MTWSKLGALPMQHFVDDFSQSLAESDIAVLVMDRAPWHGASTIKWPSNVVPLWIPPYSPECNPSERLWPLIREKLANQVFETLDALSDAVHDAIRRLGRQKEQLRSVTGYHWWMDAITL